MALSKYSIGVWRRRTPWCDRSTSTPAGSRTFAGNHTLETNSYQGGWCQLLSQLSGLPLSYCFSMSGEVKLWDIRGSDRAVETWDVFPGGLAAFDVHEQCGVFAGYELTHTLTYVMMLTRLLRLPALSSSNWRTQRAVVYSIPHPNILSTVSMNTGLTTSPTRGFPSQFIPRSGSIVFHPTEMLYGAGSPDGTGKCSILVEE